VQHDPLIRASRVDPQVLLSAHARIVPQGFFPAVPIAARAPFGAYRLGYGAG
jgi:hypothetical protein